MSYDLFFLPREGRELPTAETLEAYFAGRDYYEGGAYENPDTGVYFSFDLDSESVAFNINYVRPHFFGLEAAPELEAFVRHFDLTIDDPQRDGMGKGEFSVEGFLRGWNAGNLFGYTAVMSQDPGDIYALPTERNAEVWRWNVRRRALQDELGDDVFVPKISYAVVDENAGVQTFIVWPDGIPLAMPPVDFALIMRDELAKKRWFRKRERDYCIVPALELLPIRASMRPAEDGTYRLAHWGQPPRVIVDFIQGRDAIDPKTVGQVAPGDVLDRELVDAAR